MCRRAPPRPALTNPRPARGRQANRDNLRERYDHPEEQVVRHKPQLVFVNEANRQVGERQYVPMQYT